MALNSIVPSRELVRLVPAAFQDLSIVVLIAVTYIPETRRHFQQIREAQAIRGHRPRGLRDWRPLIVPLLVGGLERAMKLSEAMVARGHVQEQRQRKQISDSVFLIAGISLAFAGWIVAVLWGALGYVILASGGLLLVMTVIRGGRRIQRTRFTPVSWSVRDSVLVLTSLFALILVFVIWPLFGNQSLSYIPYPSAQLPEFHPVMGLAFILLAFPILLGIAGQHEPNYTGSKSSSRTSQEVGQAR
jgi:energy-coupling factor transport system permease protein